MLISPAPRHEVALSVRPLYCNRSKIVIAYPRPFISQLDRPIKSPHDRGCDRGGWGKGLHFSQTLGWGGSFTGELFVLGQGVGIGFTPSGCDSPDGLYDESLTKAA
jgi:hypothetical protein